MSKMKEIICLSLMEKFLTRLQRIIMILYVIFHFDQGGSSFMAKFLVPP